MPRSNSLSRSGSSKSRNRRKSRRKKKSTSSQDRSGNFQFYSAVRPPAPNPKNTLNKEHWRRTYENLMKWQIQHQTQYWRHTTSQLQQQNSELKRRLEETGRFESEFSSSEDEEEDDDDDEFIDEKYLEFIAITHQHQSKLKEAKEIAVEKDNSLPESRPL